LIEVLIGGAVVAGRKSDGEYLREAHIAAAQVQLERDHQILRIPNVKVKPSKSFKKRTDSENKDKK
jgi:hypothetical protein